MKTMQLRGTTFFEYKVELHQFGHMDRAVATGRFCDSILRDIIPKLESLGPTAADVEWSIESLAAAVHKGLESLLLA